MIDFDIKSVAVTRVTPNNNIKIAKPILSGFAISVFNKLAQQNNTQQVTF